MRQNSRHLESSHVTESALGKLLRTFFLSSLIEGNVSRKQGMKKQIGRRRPAFHSIHCMYDWEKVFKAQDCRLS